MSTLKLNKVIKKDVYECKTSLKIRISYIFFIYLSILKQIKL